MDAIDEHAIDEVIVSTHPSTSSGWMRRDLPERIRGDSGLPVEHIVVDIANEGLPFDVTLVVANQTVAGGELVDRLKGLAAESDRRFIVVVPQDSGDGRAVAAARERLEQLLASLEDAGIVAAGMIGDPDPFTATMNAVGYFFISEIVISTLPDNRSAWLEGGLVDRIKRQTGKPVLPRRVRRQRREASEVAVAAPHLDHDDDHHGPPEANRSSRVDPQMLGMLLFIISEIMVFGAFFTAYFFIRVVRGAEWPGPEAELPKLIAGVNTAILVSSSFTLHWAETCIKSDNRAGFKAGMLTTFLLGCTFLFIQINEYVNLNFTPQTDAQGTIFYGLTGLHGAHVFIGLTLLAMVTVRAFRGPLLLERRTAASRCRASTGTSST